MQTFAPQLQYVPPSMMMKGPHIRPKPHLFCPALLAPYIPSLHDSYLPFAHTQRISTRLAVAIHSFHHRLSRLNRKQTRQNPKTSEGSDVS